MGTRRKTAERGFIEIAGAGGAEGVAGGGLRFPQLSRDVGPSMDEQKVKPFSFYSIKCNIMFGSNVRFSAIDYVVKVYQKKIITGE